MGCACSRDSDIKVVVKAKQPLLNNSSLPIKQPYPTIASNLGGSTKNESRSERKELNSFILDLYFLNEKSTVSLPVKDNKEYILFYDFINKALFSNPEFDCNFISKYNEKKDEFDYFIENIAKRRRSSALGELRRVGDAAISWQIWINDEQEDFSSLCRESRVVHKDDVLELKYCQI